MNWMDRRVYLILAILGLLLTNVYSQTEIWTAEDLYNMRNNLNGDYILMEDINVGVPPYNIGQGWEPIGWFIDENNNEPFTGSLDGNGFVISNLYINRPSVEYQGFFGYVNGDSTDVHLTNIDLFGIDVKGNNFTGGLIGLSKNNVHLNGCKISGVVSGFWHTGGMIGSNHRTYLTNCFGAGRVAASGGAIGGLIGFNNYSVVDSCSTSTKVNGGLHTGGLVGWNYQSTISGLSHSLRSVTGGNFVGGLVGTNSHSDIIASYSESAVNGYTSVGGLVGWNLQSTVANSYSMGEVNGSNGVGGFVGHNDVANIVHSFSIGEVISDGNNVGGLVGNHHQSTTTHSYWNISTSGQVTSASGLGRVTDQMVYPYAENTYLGWDFISYWGEDTDHSANRGYPYLLEEPLIGDELEHINIVFIDESRDSREISTEIFHPVSDSLNAFRPNESYPLVVFGHGWLMNYSFYQSLTLYLVSQGWIVALPRTEEGLFPEHEDFALDLMFLGNQFQLENIDPDSYLYGMVDSTAVVMGHSMGGGSSILATAGDNNPFDSVVTFAAAETDPSAIEAALDITIPSLTFSAADDNVTPPGTNQEPIFENLDSVYKCYVSLQGVTHLGIISSMVAFDVTSAWLDFILSDEMLDTFEDVLEQNVPNITYIIENNYTSIDDNPLIAELDLQLMNYPNPFNPETTFSFFMADSGEYELKIYDIKGRLVERISGYGEGKQSIVWNAAEQSSGVYFYRLSDGRKSETGRCLLLK
jgi:pimeloyl-ACP methyl ester carboxylesterase